MVVAITHNFTSAKGDGPDPTVVRPSDWNDPHKIEVGADSTILGRAPGLGPGAVQELPMSSVFAPGMMLMYGGPVAPATWHLCDGGLLSRTTEAALFAAIGTTYGVGDGSTTFAKPDMRGRVAAHPDGGAGRLTASYFATAVLGASGGVQAESAGVSVSGTITVSGSVGGTLSGSNINNLAIRPVADGPGSCTDQTFAGQVLVNVSGTLGGAMNGGNGMGGATSAVTNVQPTLIVNYIIKG